MIKQAVIVFLGLTTTTYVFAQQSFFQSSGNQQGQGQSQTQAPLTPPMPPNDFKNSEKGVRALAQKNLDNLNQQLTDMINKNPPPPVPPPPKISGGDKNSQPQATPESIQLPETGAGGSQTQQNQNAPATPGAPPIPPPPAVPQQQQQQGSSGASESSSVFTGFQGMPQNQNQNKKQNTTPSGGGFNIKY